MCYNDGKAQIYMCKKRAAKRSRNKKKGFQEVYCSEKKVMTEAGFEPSTSGLVSIAHQLLSQTSITWHI